MLESFGKVGRSISKIGVRIVQLVKPRKGVSSLILLVGLLFVLTSCDNNAFWGPIAIKRDGSQLLVVFCSEVSAEKAYASAKNVQTAEPWSHFWEARGSTTIAKGYVLTLGADVPGLTTTESAEYSLKPGETFDISFGKADGTGVVSGIFGGGQNQVFSEVRWLHSDGKETDSPCPGHYSQ